MSNLNELLKKIEDEGLRTELEKSINTNYIGRNIAHEDDEIKNRFYGKTFGSLETKLKRNSKLFGDDLIQPSEIDELGFENALDEVSKRAAERLNEYKKLADTNGSSDSELKEKNKELLSQIDQYTQKINDLEQFRSQVPKLQDEISQWEQKHENFKVNLELNGRKEQALKSIPFTDQLKGAAKDYAIKGFKDNLNSKYKIELGDDSKDGLRITEIATNKRPVNGSEFMTFEEIATLEAKNAGLLKVSNGSGGNDKTIIFDYSKRETDVNSEGMKFKGAK